MSATPGREASVLPPAPSPGPEAAAGPAAQSAIEPGNGIRLGRRARRVIRSAARLVNPLVLRIAGRRHMPVVGILRHRGRKTGRAYATPLGIRPAAAGGFVMPLTFGEAAGWYRNIVAAGWCVITWRGQDHTAANPVIVGRATALPAFPTRSEIWLKLLERGEAARGPAITAASRDRQPAGEHIVTSTARTRPAGRVRAAASGRSR